MKRIQSYQDLNVWQIARKLVKRVYELTVQFPKQEQFGLTHQLRRAAVSVPSNIAEGYGRGTRKDYVHFLHQARGSLYEMETQLILARDLNYVSIKDEEIERELVSCSKMLHALIGSLETKNGKGS